MATKNYNYKYKSRTIVNSTFKQRPLDLNLNQNNSTFPAAIKFANDVVHKHSNKSLENTSLNEEINKKGPSWKEGFVKGTQRIKNPDFDEKIQTKIEENAQKSGVNNNSTLSLHIAAYENSVEAASDDSMDDGKSNVLKKAEISVFENWEKRFIIEHLCNTLLVDYSPQTNITQECTFSTDLPEQHTLIYRNCSEEWCFTFISSDKAGGATTTQKGCESRSLLKHVQNKAIDEEFKNNTEWHYSKPLYDSPRCNEIITASGLNEENQFSQKDIRVCLDIEFIENDIPSKGKICCCKGKNNCNGNDLLWSEVAITMKDIEKFREFREKNSNNENSLNSSAAETKTIETFFSHAFSIFILFFALF